MRNKPEKDRWVSPSIRKPAFDVLNPEEADEFRGGTGWGAGVCAVVGFACYAAGSFGLGFCLGPGYSSGVTPSAPAPPPPAPPPPTPTPTPTPTPPSAPASPSMTFVNPPPQVKAGVRTRFTYYTHYNDMARTNAETKFELVVPDQKGVMTQLRGEDAHAWQPAERKTVATGLTANSNFSDAKRGQIMAEILIDHVSPNGQSDCKLKVTDIFSGKTISTTFKVVP